MESIPAWYYRFLHIDDLSYWFKDGTCRIREIMFSGRVCHYDGQLNIYVDSTEIYAFRLSTFDKDVSNCRTVFYSNE